jgi:hypothetical protein
MSKPQGMCVYCGGLGVTKQHVWPEWMKYILPKPVHTVHNHNKIRGREVGHRTMELVPSFEEHRGPIGSRKIRNVCSRCNGGWMSRLETAAKPILTELILGRRCHLDSRAQTSIAAWTMMTSITAEYTDVPTQCIPAEDRHFLMANGKPHVGWRVWIGRYRGDDWKQRYSHWGNKLGFYTPTGVDWHGFQTSVFVVGELLLYAASSTDVSLLAGFHPIQDDALAMIWPPSDASVDSHQLRFQTDAETQEIAFAVLGYMVAERNAGSF